MTERVEDDRWDSAAQALPEGEGPLQDHRLESFFREHYQSLLQFLRRRTATEEDARDATQESLARLLRYRQSQSPEEWQWLLYRIAVNVANDQSRHAATQAGRPHVAIETVDVASPQPTPEEIFAREQQAARLSEAILQLPPKCQRVYLLKRVHNLSRAQIAQRCGISVKMVEKHLATALVLLRRKVGDTPAGTF
ncbi:MAG TPA: sigma-70 family RNA polymerase sigma factor [Tahibacter sp.]|nr:sigma-70 family RNA polymerase sigma factor [Tahibacter sp.]